VRDLSKIIDATRPQRLWNDRPPGRMSSDVIIGHDGKAALRLVRRRRYRLRLVPRRGLGYPHLRRVRDGFEALTLGVFEVGLSWSIVFGKRTRSGRQFQGLRRREGRGDDRAGR